MSTQAGPNVVPIPRVTFKKGEPRPTAKEIRDEYFAKSKIAVFEGFLEWPALQRWDFKFFKEKYGAIKTQANLNCPADMHVPYDIDSANYVSQEITVREVIEMIENGDPNVTHYISQQPVEKFPGLADDINLDDVCCCPTDERQAYVWIGGKNTRSGYHFDLVDNALLQVMGQKHVRLVAPSDAANMYPYADFIHKSKVDPTRPELFPNYQKLTVYEAVLNPGDLLILPSTWYHYLTSLSNSISCNVWMDATSYRPPESLPFSAMQRLSFKTAYYYNFARSFLGFPPHLKMFAPPANGSTEGVEWRNYLLSWIPFVSRKNNNAST